LELSKVFSAAAVHVRVLLREYSETEAQTCIDVAGEER
jgi:hypothetical protein